MLSVGLIGTGTISHAHLSAYLDLQEEVRIVALADIAAEKADRNAPRSLSSLLRAVVTITEEGEGTPHDASES